jgi:DNA (cytosine-5)-methyltransferase 1
VRYGSVCSGIEAATVAWHQLGWEPVFFSEIEKFPSAVLAHHYPNVPNHGDMTKFKEWLDADINVLVGGTPCQSFSVAGLRKGLDDPRGNLMLTYLAIADRYRPEWVVWENVPGVLSSNGGRDFGTFLGGLGQLGYGFAYRVFDARFFGVAQRRRRVFLVANSRGWHRAAAVLFERASLSGNPAPRREARQAAAAGVAGGACQRRWPAEIASTLNASFGSKQGLEDQHALGGAELFVPTPVFATSGQTNAAFCADQALALNATNEPPYVAHTLRASQGSEDGTGRGTPLVPVHAFDARQSNVIQYGDKFGPLDTDGHSIAVAQPVAFQPYVGGVDYENNAHAMDEPTGPLMKGSPTGGGRPLPAIATAMQVRRLTPVECERLQGFPDGYTNIPWRKSPESPDGPRYKALGNSMAVPCMKWIGERIQQVSEI